LLARANGPPVASDQPLEPLAAVEGVAGALAATLSRWFGPYGYHALLSRALAEATADHPALAAVRVRSPLDPTLEGLSDAARAHGSGATVDALTTVVAGIVELLGRLIGDDMAVNLVELAAPARSRTTAHVDDKETPS
jgi:hypothetical protein